MKIHCTNCGKLTRYQDGLCQSCRRIPITSAPAAVIDPTAPAVADANLKPLWFKKNRGGKKMKVLKAILYVLGCVLLFALLCYTGTLIFNNIKTAANAGTTVPTMTTVATDATAVTTGIIPDETVVSTETTAAIATASADGKYVLDGVTMDLSKVLGFVPDAKLLLSDLKSETLGLEEVSLTRDFQKYLNTERDGFGCLAGYTDGTNDYNQYYNHESAPQVPAYSWMIHTGEYIQMPGIGTLQGSQGNAVMVLIINRTDKVYRFPDNSVTVIAGFQGWGRIWNGESKEVVETEMRLTNHYLTRLGEGVPETGFIGQTDQGAENASTVTVVTVEMLDVGQFRLIRAETVAAMK